MLRIKDTDTNEYMQGSKYYTGPELATKPTRRMFYSYVPYRAWLELVAILIPIGFFWAFTFNQRNTLPFPRMHVYDIRQVLDPGMSLVLAGDAYKEQQATSVIKHEEGITTVFGSADTDPENFADMTKVQAAKYASMCYGNREDGHLVFAEHTDSICYADDALAHTNPWWIATKHDYAWARALMLEKWQVESEYKQGVAPFRDRSFCTCMDQMSQAKMESIMVDRSRVSMASDMKVFFDRYAREIPTADDKILYDYLLGAYVQSHSQIDLTMLGNIEQYMQLIGTWMAQMSNATATNATQPLKPQHPLAGQLQVNLQNVIDRMRTANMPKKYLDGHVDDDFVEQLKFCQQYSMPKQTIMYRGVMDSWRYIACGQAVLLISCFYSFQIFWHQMNQNPSLNAEEQGLLKSTDSTPLESVHSAYYWMTKDGSSRLTWIFWPMLRWLLYLVCVVVYPLMDFQNETFSDAVRPSTGGTNEASHGMQAKFTEVEDLDVYLYWTYALPLAVLILLLEPFIAFYHYGHGREECVKEPDVKDVLKTRVLMTILQDLANILALTLLVVGVLLQNGQQEVISIQSLCLLVLSLALAQHVSNILNVVFDLLAVGPRIEGKHDARLERLLLRTCYVRAGIFMLIFLGALLLVTRVGVTKVHTPHSDVKSMGLVLYCVLFVVLLCGFDFFYELFNIDAKDVDEKSKRVKLADKRWMHTVFVYVYVTFVNFISSQGL